MKAQSEFDGPVYYFAYSVHLDPRWMKMDGVKAASASCAELLNHRLMFNVLEDEHFFFERCGLANIVPSAGDRVEGVLYEIEEEALPCLDELAGVSRLKYYRKRITAARRDGSTTWALTYAGWPDKTATNLAPRESDVRQMARRAAMNGFSPAFVEWLSRQKVGA